jgi:hypothetical protein
MPRSDEYLFVDMIFKAKYKLCAATMLFQILQRYFLVKTFVISKDSQENVIFSSLPLDHATRCVPIHAKEVFCSCLRISSLKELIQLFLVYL